VNEPRDGARRAACAGGDGAGAVAERARTVGSKVQGWCT
jgi:hypothetical protein